MKIKDMFISDTNMVSIKTSLIDRYNKERELREKILEQEELLNILQENKNRVKLETQNIIDIANKELLIIQEKIAKAKNQLEQVNVNNV